MAHTKSQGSVKGNRDSVSKRLGLKIAGGQVAAPGNIIIRQRGTKVHPGLNTYMGKDYTIHATLTGVVSFKSLRGKKIVEIVKNLPKVTA